MISDLNPKVKICGITSPHDAQLTIDSGGDSLFALGFIFTPISPRCIDISQCKEIIDSFNHSLNQRSKVELFGVFQDQTVEEVHSIVTQCGLDVIQLHGNEYCDYLRSLRASFQSTKPKIVKAYRVDETTPLSSIIDKAKELEGLVDMFLLDGPFLKTKNDSTDNCHVSFDDYQAFSQSVNKEVILAGGIGPQNIAKVVEGISKDNTMNTPEKTYGKTGIRFIDICSGVEETKGRKSSKLLSELFSQL